MKTKSAKKNMNAMPMLTLRQMAKITGGGEPGVPGGGGTDKISINK